jgi:hypothetical protein
VVGTTSVEEVDDDVVATRVVDVVGAAVVVVELEVVVVELVVVVLATMVEVVVVLETPVVEVVVVSGAVEVVVVFGSVVDVVVEPPTVVDVVVDAPSVDDVVVAGWSVDVVVGSVLDVDVDFGAVVDVVVVTGTSVDVVVVSGGADELVVDAGSVVEVVVAPASEVEVVVGRASWRSWVGSGRGRARLPSVVEVVAPRGSTWSSRRRDVRRRGGACEGEVGPGGRGRRRGGARSTWSRRARRRVEVDEVVSAAVLDVDDVVGVAVDVVRNGCRGRRGRGRLVDVGSWPAARSWGLLDDVLVVGACVVDDVVRWSSSWGPACTPRTRTCCRASRSPSP